MDKLKMNQSTDQKVSLGRKLTPPLVEPVSPLTQLSGPTFRARRAVVEYYVGRQVSPDDALLPMPPHNKVLKMAEIMQMLQQKLLTSTNIWHRALQFMKRKL
ncbi:hypothetical protein KR026_005935 [Drosophila bipectinata]|nr:uncharacterized protein LOC108121673 [Drosophila bipectinata]KAH8266868.1 hypothetical protein KR026_005935 [Drosophila bipectinata]